MRCASRAVLNRFASRNIARQPFGSRCVSAACPPDQEARRDFFPARATVKTPALNGTAALDLPHFGSSGGKARRETARNGRSVTPDKPVRQENRGKGSGPRVCFKSLEDAVLLDRLAGWGEKRRRSGAAARLFNKNMQLETALNALCGFWNLTLNNLGDLFKCPARRDFSRRVYSVQNGCGYESVFSRLRRSISAIILS